MPTVLNNVFLPQSVVEAGVRGRQVRMNTRVRNQAGFVDVTPVWYDTLREFEVGFNGMRIAQWQAVEGVFEVTMGGAYGFLMEDPKDNKTDGSGTLIATDSEGVFRLGKTYTAMGTTVSRNRFVNRPKAGLSLYRGGAPVTIGASAGNATVNMDTGRVTFVADTTRTVTLVTVGATTQVTLSSALPSMSVGGRVFLSGLAGADAALLNGKYHAITAIASATYTLSTNTAGKTISSGAGVAAKYPQPSEILEWVGGFWVPIQFASDVIEWELVVGGPAEKRLLMGPTVKLVEVREA